LEQLVHLVYAIAHLGLVGLVARLMRSGRRR
jgi:hypothetical protein